MGHKVTFILFLICLQTTDDCSYNPNITYVDVKELATLDLLYVG